MSGMRCKSSGLKDFYERRTRNAEFGIERADVRIWVTDRPAGSIATESRVGRHFRQTVVASGTSVGANYRAATRARSRADFIAKLGIAEEECDETIYWMDMLIELKLIREHRTRELRGEAEELLAIIVSSIKTPRRNKG